MRMIYSRSIAALAIALCCLLAASPGHAQETQGKTGTTITFDGKSSKGLFSKSASKKTVPLYAYARHIQTNINLISVNADGSTIDITTGLFTNTANNILYTTDDKIALGMNGSSTYRPAYYGIVAPKGYRIIRVTLDVDATDKDIEFEDDGQTSKKNSADNTWNSVTFQEVLFGENGTSKTFTNSLTVSANNHVFDIVKTQPTNVIYFTQNYSGGGYTLLNSLKITYVIDQPFTQQMPSAEGTDSIHTGDINLGKFSGSSIWGFQRDGITDTQQVPVWVGSNGSTPTQTTPEIVKVGNDQYFVAATEGDYYLEAPAKFRIIGATVNFLSQTYKEVTSIESGKEYLIGDGTNYLTLSGSTLGNTTDKSEATKWTFTSSNNGYTIKSGSSYLYIERSGNSWNYTYTLKASTSSAQSWKYNNSKLQNATHTTRYLAYDSGWKANTTGSSIKFYEEIVSTGEPGFTTTVYGRDGKTEPQTSTLTASNDKATVELTGFNNDAIHFNISDLKGGKALYNVNLQLMPLDPEVQKLSVGCLEENGEVTGKTTVTSENFVMATNDSKTAYVLAPDKDLTTCQIAFDDAYNEQRTMWYTDGSKENDGYSNYFLVGSDADNGGDDDVLLNANNDKYEKARVHATVAGTTKLDFTNIGEFDRTATTTNPEYLKYNEFSKKSAGISSDILTLELKNAEGTTKQSDPKTVYVYTADQPTFNIMPEGSGTKHIDYRYYDITVQAIAKMTPVVKVDNILIYNSTLKGKPNKASSTLTRDETLDNDHKYVGITVSASLDGEEVAEGTGVLASADIIDAIKTALQEYEGYGFNKDDILRGILYLDMSKLKSSDNTQLKTFDEQTADNCLYFMYPGYQAQSGSRNVITKTANAFEATSSIKIYDQQPFYTPYDFSTGTHTVNYEREGTHGKAKVTQMSCILPFDINLDGNGHPKSANDQTDTNVTFRQITSSGELKGSLGNQEYSYAVAATEVKDDKAKANTPYHVTTEIEDGGFTFNILNAKFAKTPATTNGTEATLTDNGTTWKAYGTYAGLTPAKADNRFIFASGYYRKTGAQVDNNVAYVLPFRAYFDTTDKNAAKTNAFAVVTDFNDIVTGIGNVKANGNNGLTIHAGHGCFSVTADYDTAVKAFTVGGQMVANGSISKGETVSYNVPQGVYIVNGVKVVVK